MKTKFILLVLMGVICNFTIAQKVTDYSKLSKVPSFYIGFGSGLNYNCGLIGLKLAGRISDKILIDASAGIGSWGNKLGLGIILNAKNENAWCPIIGVSRATGIESTPLNIEVINSSGNKITNNFDVKISPATMVNIGVQRQWIRPTGNRITLELGYSVLVSGGEATLLTPGYSFTDISKKVFDLIKPGGLTVGFGYYFALK